MDPASTVASEPWFLTSNRVETSQRCHPRVLIVDDDETTAKTFLALLLANGFDGEFVLSGADAILYTLRAPPAAVILDLHLADDDVPGFMVLQSLRAKYPELTIIAVTGWYLRDEHELEARALGLADYLFKPVDDSTMVASLRAALSARAGHGCERPENTAAAAERAASGEAAHDARAATSDCRGHEAAACEGAFINNWLRHLVREIRDAFPNVWDDVIVEQVEDTLLEFLGKVKRGIWPVRRSLNGHLHQAAWRNVRDQVQAAARRRANETRYAREEAQRAQAGEAPNDLEAVLSFARSDAETESLRRWLGQESPGRIAEALGVSQLPWAEQLKEVKRFKDRIKKRARRRTGD